MSVSFSSEEIAILRSYGIVLFAERVIFAAQEPMSKEDIAAVESLCSGKIPSSLLDLWSLTAGGRLAYDLKVEMAGREEPISWTELFYNGSKTYRDLKGWIQHEQELCEESAEDSDREWNGKLDFLPFGGFEYLDRVYVVVAPGSDYGKVLAWKQGLPPAWEFCLNEDSVATFADDLYAAFAKLYVQEDPRDPNAKYAMGEELLKYLDKQVVNGLSRQLADKVISYFCQASIDWEGALEDGSICSKPVFANAAIRHAIVNDDGDLIGRLAKVKIDLDKPLQGRAIPTEFAMVSAKFLALQALIDAGAPVSENILQRLNRAVPASLMSAILEKGAQPNLNVVVNCAACGAPDSARLAAARCTGDDLKKSFEQTKSALLKSLEKDLKLVRAKKLGHYLGEEGLALRVSNLKQFKNPFD